jgi:phage terminase large subunit-like protein
MTTPIRAAVALRAHERHTMGPRVARWIQANCVHTLGDWEGEPFRPTWWQRGILNRIFALHYDPIAGRWRRIYKRVLLGLPSGSGKTELIAAVGLYLLEHERSPVIPLVASSRDQAGELYQAAQIMASHERSPLRNRMDAGQSRITLRDGRLGFIHRVSAADGSNEGKKPSAMLGDEWHVWPETRDTYATISKGLAKRAEGLEIMITTAGYDLDTQCGRAYQYGQKVRAGEVDDPTFLFVWIEAPEGADLEDWERYREWHPAIESGFMSIEAIQHQFRTIRRSRFVRYFLNNWVEGDEDPWVTEEQWRACAVEVDETGYPPGIEWTGPAHAFWDASTKYDSTAVGYVRPCRIDGRDRLWVDGRIFERPFDPRTNKLAEDWQIPEADCEEYLWQVRAEHGAVAIQFDPAFITWNAQRLEAAGLPMREFAQNGTKMIAGTQGAYKLIVDGVLAHRGDPIQTRQVRAARARQVRQGGGGERLEKGWAKAHIDWAVGMVMGVWSFQHPGDHEEEMDIEFY